MDLIDIQVIFILLFFLKTQGQTHIYFLTFFKIKSTKQ